MTVWTTVALHGPNRWSPRSVLELHAPRSLANGPASVSTAIAESLESFLDLGRYTTTHPASVSVARDRLASIRSATHRGALWGRLAGWMSAMSGVPSPELELPDKKYADGHLASCAIAALDMEEERLSYRCFAVAAELIEAFESGREFSIAAKVRELFDYADDVRLGPSSRAILDVALQRGIPYYRLTKGSLVQLGEGRYQRRIWTAETDATSAIAESIASDKDLTKRLLRNVGVPVPLGRLVTGPEDAWTAAQEVGFPVVVKPRDANHQRGISIELTERDEIVKAYHWAIEDGQTQDVIVEQFARGQHHRLLVIGDALVAASRGHMETITGDGARTVAQLVHALNQDPRRGEAYTDPLSVVNVDAAALIELSKQGLNDQSIPEHGQVVVICRTGDLTTDCTEAVHPETARQAVLAARVVGLDIAGLDVLATDISHPLASQRGAVVEVNAGPSLTPHVSPLFGQPRPVGEAIIEMLFPDGRKGRIPMIAVIAMEESESTQALEQIMSEYRNRIVGRIEGDAIFLGDERIPLVRSTMAERVQALVGHPHVETLVVPISFSALASQASPLPRIDRLVLCESACAAAESAAFDDAWSTLRHAIHADTLVDWSHASAQARARIAPRLKA